MINELVKRLSENKHKVVIGHRDEPYEEIKKRIEDGYVYIKFTQTKGGTELGVNVDNHLTHVEEADFETGKGTLHVAGTCDLNFQKVRCIADIDLETRQGIGYLELLDESGQSMSNTVQ